MKRDTVPARPLAGARVDGGNDGQSEPRQEETLLARKVECKTCQPVRSTVLQSSSVVPTTPNQSEPMHRSGAGAKVPSSQSGHAAMRPCSKATYDNSKHPIKSIIHEGIRRRSDVGKPHG